jgi:hypothetical protein
VAEKASALLEKLEQLKYSYGAGAGAAKLELLKKLERRRLRSADEVMRLHECLVFWRAYPDDKALLTQVVRMLELFSGRSDLKRHASALADSGIAGTPIYYSFFWPTACWLARNWPGELSIDWSAFEDKQKIIDFIHLLMPYSESPVFDMLDFTARQWIDKLKGEGESDAAFLVRRFMALRADPDIRETLYESFDIPMKLKPAEGSPSRTLARYRPSPVVFHDAPPTRERPSLRRELKRPPLSIKAVSPREGERIIDLAREAMVTRSRDLEVFAQADPKDVRIVSCGGGLQFACIGAKPERRLMLEAVYGFLTLKNGVPAGYVLASSLFNSTEVAYNIFDTYRGAEAGAILGRVISMMHHMFGADTFSIDPYQLGYGNAEGLESGAWWFYYKMGFRPKDPEVRRLLRGELARIKRNRHHRTDPATLEQMASEYVFLHTNPKEKIAVGSLSIGTIGMRISGLLADRHGADRERALRECSREAALLLGVRSMRSWSPGERLAWKRWSPLVLLLKGVKRWSPQNKRALVRVVRAKGGRRETDFVRLFDGHRLLKKAVLALAEE